MKANWVAMPSTGIGQWDRCGGGTGLSPTEKLQEKEKRIRGTALGAKNKTKPRSVKNHTCMGRKGIMVNLGGEIIWEVKYRGFTESENKNKNKN